MHDEASRLRSTQNDDDDLVFPVRLDASSPTTHRHEPPSRPSSRFQVVRESSIVPPLNHLGQRGIEESDHAEEANTVGRMHPAAMDSPPPPRPPFETTRRPIDLSGGNSNTMPSAPPQIPLQQHPRKRHPVKACGFKTIPGIGGALSKGTTDSFLRVLPPPVVTEQQQHRRDTGDMGDPLFSVARRSASSSLLCTPCSSTGSFPVALQGRTNQRPVLFTQSGFCSDESSSSFLYAAPPPPLMMPTPPQVAHTPSGMHTRAVSMGGKHQPPPQLHDTLRPRARDHSPPMPATMSSSVVTPTASTTVFAENYDDDDDDGFGAVDTTADAAAAAREKEVLGSSVRNENPLAVPRRRPFSTEHHGDDDIIEDDVESECFHESGSYSTGGDGSKRASSDVVAAIGGGPGGMQRGSSSILNPMPQSIMSILSMGSMIPSTATPQLSRNPASPHSARGSTVRIVAHDGDEDVVDYPRSVAASPSTTSPQGKRSTTNHGSMMVPKPPQYHHHHGPQQPPTSAKPTSVTPAQPLFRWRPLLRAGGAECHDNGIINSTVTGGDGGAIMEEDDEEDGCVVLLESMSTASTTTIQSKRSASIVLQKPKQHHSMHGCHEGIACSPDRSIPQAQPQARAHRHHHHHHHSSSPAAPLLQSGAAVPVTDLPRSPPRRPFPRHSSSGMLGGENGLLSAFSSPTGVLSRDDSARGSSGGWWSSVSSYSDTSSAPQSPRR
jgi:hypothetical protein